MHYLRIILCSCIVSLILIQSAAAQSSIRDEELESIIREMADPIFVAAGLTPENIDIVLLQNSDINAFVTGGQNIFFHTGLLTLSTSPALVMGTMAHETGHISGGHLSRNRQAAENASLQSALGYILGAATAVAGSPAAAQAIIAGSQHAVSRNFLSHTRGNEAAADQAALNYLEKVHYPADGLLELLNTLYHREKIAFGNALDPYALTHPLSNERINHIKHYVKENSIGDGGFSKDQKRRYMLAIVKLRAFLGVPQETLKAFPQSDKSEAAHYARAIAYYRLPDLSSALKNIDFLLRNYPINPFYHELKGQILFEHSRVTQSIPYYEQALKLLPNSMLFKAQLASAMIATEENNRLNRAINLLNQAKTKQPRSTFLWRQLGIAYGRLGDLGLSNLALAEEAILSENKRAAERFIDLAEQHIKPGSSSYLRLLDLKEILEDK
jgi:predicted Zn-dependent protease